MLRLLVRLGEEFRHRVSLMTTPVDKTRVVHTRANGCDLLVRANEDVGRAIHYARNFELLETQFLKSVIGPQSVCFDIGANCGYFAMLMAKAATHGHVHAFEPLPFNAALLRTSAHINGFKNITLNESAVGAFDGVVEFVQAEDSAYSSMRDTARKPVVRRFEVPIVRLDTYCNGANIQRIDLLKVDIEGAEGLMIEGASGVLGDVQLRPKIMMIELVQQNLEVFSASISEIVDLLKSYGYKTYKISRSGQLENFDILNDTSSYNIIFKL